jgi:hypothetical protein
MDLEKIIIQTLIEYQFGDNLKNGDYITGVKKMYFGEVAAMVVKKYNDIHNVVGQSEQCAHPRDKREYIGSNMLRCKVCGKEFS